VGSNSQPPASGLAEGQTLAGKYALVRQLGAGGMCVVYEAEHVALGQAIAVKVLKPELARDADCVARFEREARAAAQLRSPNVARVFDVDWAPGGQPYITMELLVGHDLGTELARSGRLPLDLAVDYVRQACSGISEAHALGIVHRDLKPENLFLTELGDLTDRRLVKILDFGIAKHVTDEARRLTAPDAVFGTVDYMSPEQIRSASKVDLRSDLWSLGVILYELLTGRTPWQGDARSVIAQIVSDPVRPPTHLVPDLPPSIVATIMKALQKDPEERFQSADELRAALDGYADLEPITSVIGRLPPQSMPRRTGGRSVPPPPATPLSPSARDARTHGEWETKPEMRPRARPWLAAPVALLAGAAVFAVVRYRAEALALVAGRPPAATTAAPATLPPELPVAAASATPASEEPPTTPAAATSMGASAPAAPSGKAPKTTRPASPGARPTTRAPSVASAPAEPLPAPTPPRMPKHL